MIAQQDPSSLPLGPNLALRVHLIRGQQRPASPLARPASVMLGIQARLVQTVLVPAPRAVLARSRQSRERRVAAIAWLESLHLTQQGQFVITALRSCFLRRQGTSAFAMLDITDLLLAGAMRGAANVPQALTLQLELKYAQTVSQANISRRREMTLRVTVCRVARALTHH